MTQPVAQLRKLWSQPEDGVSRPLERCVFTFCPGCLQLHPFRIQIYDYLRKRSDGSEYPVWEWDGNLECPTFAPSMLAYFTVHLCPPDYVHRVECMNPDSCGELGYIVMSENPRVLGHVLPHIVPLGNCHSYLRQGRWEFLGDSTHALAGQTVDMIPLPDWIVN